MALPRMWSQMTTIIDFLKVMFEIHVINYDGVVCFMLLGGFPKHFEIKHRQCGTVLLRQCVRR